MAYEALADIVTDPAFLELMKKCTKYKFTSILENVHSLILKYLPKRVHFGKARMEAGVRLAILEHNENANRKVAVDKETGEEHWIPKLSKSSKKWSLRPIKEVKTFMFRQRIWEAARRTWKNREDPLLHHASRVRRLTSHLPTNTARFPRPPMEELQSAHDEKLELARRLENIMNHYSNWIFFKSQQSSCA